MDSKYSLIEKSLGSANGSEKPSTSFNGFVSKSSPAANGNATKVLSPANQQRRIPVVGTTKRPVGDTSTNTEERLNSENGNRNDKSSKKIKFTNDINGKSDNRLSGGHSSNLTNGDNVQNNNGISSTSSGISSSVTAISSSNNNVTSTTTTNGKQKKSLLEQRQSLPVYACRHRLIHEVKKSNTILLMGETGSGKTTQIPQFLHEAGYANKGMIAVTQPRRVAAITVSKRVAEEMSCKLGDIVGFTVRFEDCTSDVTKIRFITDGCLVREALSDRLLRNYSVIILDEVHERTIHTDVLFGIVKEAQSQRTLRNMTPLKIIITSATMDIDHFGKYFGVSGMFLEGKTFPVRVFNAKESRTDYQFACLVTLLQIHSSAPANHDVLVFLTGQEEIEAMVHQTRQIIKSNELKGPTLRVFPLYSQLPQNKQLECFIPSPPNTRKVIFATNIAETSLTIPGIRYVIDSGYIKRRVYNPANFMESLKVVRISQAQSWQRCGRAGRDAAGFCYRIYTSEEMDSFENMPVPEILRSNFFETALQLLALGIDCKTFDFLDKPSSETIQNAYKQLQTLGAIKSIKLPELTSLGRKMSLFPLDPRYSKLLLVAPEYGCLEEMLSIVAILSGENIFITSTEKRDLATVAHAKFHSRYGDHITLLNVYKAFQKTDRIKMWCHENFLNARNLLYARDVRNQLKEICQKCDLKISSCNDHVQIRKCLLAGLFNNVAELQCDKFYLTVTSRQKAKIHPSSVFSGKPNPEYILYTEILSTERNYLRNVTEIESEWLKGILHDICYQNNTFNCS